MTQKVSALIAKNYILCSLLALSFSASAVKAQEIERHPSPHQPADADFELGLSFYWGHGGESIDRSRAFNLFSSAASRGHTLARSFVVTQLALGEGVPVDQEEAKRQARNCHGSLETLARDGDPRAQVQLGLFYKHGIGVEKNAESALRWFKRATSENLPEAQFHLGSMYLHRGGARRNKRMAMNWLHRAAVQGLADAQFKVGFMYEAGDGVKQDPEIATSWFKRAADRNHQTAQKHLCERR